MTQGRSDDERAVSKMLREANEAAGRFRAGDASRDPFDELSALSRGFTAAKARLTDDALDHAADYVAERTARLAAEAQVAQLCDGLANIINNLTARLDGGADRTAALDALREVRALAAASGVAPDKPAPTCEHGETRPHDTFTVHMWPPPVRPVTCPGPDVTPDHDHRNAWDAHVTASRQAGLCEYSGMTVQRCKDIDLCDCFDQPNGDDDAHS